MLSRLRLFEWNLSPLRCVQVRRMSLFCLLGKTTGDFQGWIARRTYSSFALPLVLFSENWKMPSILSSSWCFYLQIPVDCQQRYLAAAPTTVSLKTATLEPLIVLMQATGLGR